MFKKLIKVVGIVLVLLAGLFFLVKYDVMGKLYDVIDSQIAEDTTSDETPGRVLLTDKEGNEVVIEYEKKFVYDEEGNKVEFWEDTSQAEEIYQYTYIGTLEKIANNKIYFMVDKEIILGVFLPIDVDDYEVVFDIDDYALDFDPYDTSYFFSDCLFYKNALFFSASELEFLVGEYLKVKFYEFKDAHTGDIYKGIEFF